MQECCDAKLRHALDRKESFSLPPPLGSAGIGWVTPNSIREKTSQVGTKPGALGPEDQEVYTERCPRDKASTELTVRNQTTVSALGKRSLQSSAVLLLCMCLADAFRQLPPPLTQLYNIHDTATQCIPGAVLCGRAEVVRPGPQLQVHRRKAPMDGS